MKGQYCPKCGNYYSADSAGDHVCTVVPVEVPTGPRVMVCPHCKMPLVVTLEPR